ncbi:centrosomal protein of 78 kDa-like [Haliotis rubra]|uniref:centrosomal protein of 78 kDa-like n=1 Tax=Haliotis rubra TaxID=36100 RepID=UPI001EE5C894|nr:centrosomal protein of 78 kDa-like [Haliotis rubra]
MIESVQVRQSGAYDFENHYDNLCALQDSVPLAAVKAHLCQGVLDINGDRVRANDWMPIVNTLRINKSLEFVAVRSYYTPPNEEDGKRAAIQKRKTPAIRSKEITFRLCRALKECLGVSSVLRCLELQGLPLRERDIETLVKGLSKNSTLNHLSLEYCRVGGPGIEVLCHGIKNCTNLSSINLTACSLTSQGAECLAQVIKHQAVKRHNEAWRDSLRYRRPDLDRMPGIRRITINSNPMLGDEGATVLAEALKDDLWLKALDMQGCGISTSGARVLLDVLKYNTTLVVLDVRANPLINRELVHSIMEQLMINSNGQDTEYKWIKAEEPVDPKKVRNRRRVTRGLNHSVAKKTTIRISSNSARRRARPGTGFLNTSRPSPGLPWRTAARANRYKGYPPEHTPGKLSIEENSEMDTNRSTSVIITRDDSILDDTNNTFQDLQPLDFSNLSIDMTNPKEVKVEMEMLRRSLKEESVARMKAEQRELRLSIENKRLSEEMKYLRHKASAGGIVSDVHLGMNGGHGAFVDESFLEGVEASFKKFHKFLDMLHEAGLSELITMAGLDQSDIMNPFDHLSSTRLSGVSFAKNNTPVSKPSHSNGVDLSVPTSAMPIAKAEPSSSQGMQQQMAFGTKPFVPNTSAYFGDISSSYRANPNVGSFEEELPITYGPVVSENNLRPGARVQAAGSRMPFPTNESIIGGPARTDDLYEKLLQDTSGVFPHIGQDGAGSPAGSLTSTPVVKSTESKAGPVKTTQPGQEGQRRKEEKEDAKGRGEDKDRPDNRKPKSDKGHGPSGAGSEVRARSQGEGQDASKQFDVSEQSEIIEVLDRAASPQKESPEHKSKMSDFNYSMDSFDQSYVSEREEVIHLGDDLDLGGSPSPPPQAVESEEDF